MAIRLTGNRRYPSVPAISQDLQNHTLALQAIKESLEIGERRTNDVLNSFVRVGELIDLGLITLEGNTTSIVGADLSEIADIGDLSGAAEGDFLRYVSGEWVNDQLANSDITSAMVTQHQAALTINWSQLTGTAPNLDDLTDVDTAGVAPGDVLTFDGAQWVASAPTGGGGGPTGPIYLDDLIDVETYLPADGEVLTWSAADNRWTAAPAPGAGGGEANTASNLGAGEGVFASKSLVDLRFKSLVAGPNVLLSSNSDEITIEVVLPTIPTLLDDLLDVESYMPADGDVLTWDAVNNRWTAVAPTGGSGGGGYPEALGHAGW